MSQTRWRFNASKALAAMQSAGRRPNRSDYRRVGADLLAELSRFNQVEHQERPQPHGPELPGVLEDLRTVVEALLAPVEDGDAPTYPEAAARARLPLGTFHDRLAQVRRDHPDTYARLMAWRRAQLAERHTRAVERRERRSRTWHRRQAARRFKERFGRYPWEPRLGLRFAQAGGVAIEGGPDGSGGPADRQ